MTRLFLTMTTPWDPKSPSTSSTSSPTLSRAFPRSGTRLSRWRTRTRSEWSFSSSASIRGATVFSKRVATWGITSESTPVRDHSRAPSATKLSHRVETWEDISRMSTRFHVASRSSLSSNARLARPRSPRREFARPKSLPRARPIALTHTTVIMMRTNVSMMRTALITTKRKCRVLTSQKSTSRTTLTTTLRLADATPTSRVLSRPAASRSRAHCSFKIFSRGRSPRQALSSSNQCHRSSSTTSQLQTRFRTSTPFWNWWSSEMQSNSYRLASLVLWILALT